MKSNASSLVRSSPRISSACTCSPRPAASMRCARERDRRGVGVEAGDRALAGTSAPATTRPAPAPQPSSRIVPPLAEPLLELRQLGQQHARQEQLVRRLAERVDRLDHLLRRSRRTGCHRRSAKHCGDAVGEPRLDGVVRDEPGRVLEVVVVEQELVHERRHREALGVGVGTRAVRRRARSSPRRASSAGRGPCCSASCSTVRPPGACGDRLEEAEACSP